ncbi:hypothetical protein CC1G_13123 [Coprinopsis cinerea okayama7|uniref:Uncharacterized protein n=1 Tax=Coprinopsis cinerea (strain Okayama-7 / 130 / ATCC MYA-4618 / FGSC 9003) TaxID=240176 RepID=A8P8Z1_COPC7|nr:hypothetical protein CC1G_13123 [Coprinopsis cinerea okayama7\|eukprot:XP_001839666.2 hypothetical protein CC1G_13123 [Coprinopsis cinerea okayama7\
MFAATFARRARLLHASSPVFKKRKAAESDDLFDEFEIVDESLQKSSEAIPGSQASSGASSSSSTTTGGVRRKLSAEERAAKFSEIVAHMKPRLGRKPQVKEAVRNSHWLQLLQLATTEEQLKEVVELLPQWKESGRDFEFGFAAAFVRRCQELKSQHLALEVFGDFAKFNVPLDIVAARQLLHSLVITHPIHDVMTASAFYNLYGLPPASQDLVSCSIIVDACLRHNTPESNAIADALLPHLRELKSKTPVNVKDTYHRENVWVKAAVDDINRILQKKKQEDLGPLLTA